MSNDGIKKTEGISCQSCNPLIINNSFFVEFLDRTTKMVFKGPFARRRQGFIPPIDSVKESCLLMLTVTNKEKIPLAVVGRCWPGST